VFHDVVAWCCGRCLRGGGRWGWAVVTHCTVWPCDSTYCKLHCHRQLVELWYVLAAMTFYYVALPTWWAALRLRPSVM